MDLRIKGRPRWRHLTATEQAAYARAKRLSWATRAFACVGFTLGVGLLYAVWVDWAALLAAHRTILCTTALVCVAQGLHFFKLTTNIERGQE